jgi:hypothetical protein
VGARILAQLALVVPGPDDLPPVDGDRTHGHVVVLERALRLADREPHEVLVAWKKALGHR